MRNWWGDYEIGVGGTRTWEISRLTLWAACRPQEVQLAWRHDPDGADRLSLDGAESPPEGAEVLRWAVNAPGTLKLRPLQPDRPIVVRPTSELRVPPGQQTSVFVGTPAWVEVSHDGSALAEVPTQQLSDTWFGPSTLDGELCYASTTAARLGLIHPLERPARVLTEIRVANRGHDMLEIERVQIPLPNLPLYRTDDHALWTPSVSLVRTASDPLAEVKVAAAPPPEAKATHRVREPRRRGDLAISIHALGAWLVRGL